MIFANFIDQAIGSACSGAFLVMLCLAICIAAMGRLLKNNATAGNVDKGAVKHQAKSLLAQGIKEWYSTAEVAQHLGKAEFTVREWCRPSRVRAEKRRSGRSWIIAREELLRLEREGLLPVSHARPRHVEHYFFLKGGRG